MPKSHENQSKDVKSYAPKNKLCPRSIVHSENHPSSQYNPSICVQVGAINSI